MKIAFTSVTFRKKSIKDILRIAKENHVDLIEWGSDIHVPTGEPHTASLVSQMSNALKIKPFSYGTYYNAVAGGNTKSIVENAILLGANNIRVWAGNAFLHKRDYDQIKFDSAVNNLKKLCEFAEKSNRTISLEKHRYTLTENPRDAVQMIETVSAVNLKSYWQPNPELTCDENCEAIRILLPYVSNIHIFSWTEKNERLPLQAKEKEWRRYMELLGNERPYIIEFVKDDREEQFAEDIEILRKWLS